MKENDGKFDVLVVEHRLLGSELPELLKQVREIAPALPIFVISDDVDYIHENRRLLPEAVYLCPELDLECVDQMIDCVGLGSRLRITS